MLCTVTLASMCLEVGGKLLVVPQRAPLTFLDPSSYLPSMMRKLYVALLVTCCLLQGADRKATCTVLLVALLRCRMHHCAMMSAPTTKQ